MAKENNSQQKHYIDGACKWFKEVVCVSLITIIIYFSDIEIGFHVNVLHFGTRTMVNLLDKYNYSHTQIFLLIC